MRTRRVRPLTRADRWARRVYREAFPDSERLPWAALHAISLRPGIDQRPRRRRHPLAKCRPVTRVLKRRDLFEIDRQHQQWRGMRAALARADTLIDQPVIMRRTLPAHASDEPKRPHYAIVPISSLGRSPLSPRAP